MGKFIRENLPDPINYYDSQGLQLTGHGRWLTGPCEFHGSSDSLRINIETGGFVCMAACGAKGGDVLDYHRAAQGLGFVEAARQLGAWQDDSNPYTGPTRPSKIPARDLLQLASEDLMTCAMVLHDVLSGRLTESDIDLFRESIARIIFVSEVANG
jgi:hypothetical protein